MQQSGIAVFDAGLFSTGGLDSTFRDTASDFS